MADAPQDEGFIIFRPVDQSEYLDGPTPEYIDPKDEAKMAQVRKYEQSLKARGITPLTPTFPDLFEGGSDGG